MKTPLLAVVCLTFLAGCVTMPEKMTVTPSGNPEVEIATKDISAIKAAVISRLVNEGYSVEKDTDYSLELTRATKGAEDFAAALSIGNSYSSNRRFVVYTFIKRGDIVRVIAAPGLRAQMPGGQVNTMPLSSGNVYNLYQQQLFDIKAEIERQAKADAPAEAKGAP
jgi:hypothetical protein